MTKRLMVSTNSPCPLTTLSLIPMVTRTVSPVERLHAGDRVAVGLVERHHHLRQRRLGPGGYQRPSAGSVAGDDHVGQGSGPPSWPSLRAGWRCIAARRWCWAKRAEWSWDRGLVVPGPMRSCSGRRRWRRWCSVPPVVRGAGAARALRGAGLGAPVVPGPSLLTVVPSVVTVVTGSVVSELTTEVMVVG